MQPRFALAVLMTVVACFTGSYSTMSGCPSDTGKNDVRVGSGVIPGRPVDVSTSDPTVIAMAKFALSEICIEYVLISIRRAQEQIVSGMMYILTLDVERRRRGSTVAYTCQVKVWDQPWLENTELEDFHCTR